MQRFFKHLTDRDFELGAYALIVVVLSVAACGVLWFSSGAFRTLW